MQHLQKFGTLNVTAIALILAGIFFATPIFSESNRRLFPAPIPENVPPRPENSTACNYQEPQEFLIRDNFTIKARMSPEERRERMEIHAKTVEYRTKEYGYFEGYGQKSWNSTKAAHNAKLMTFMGLKVRLNKRLEPVLQCVEQQILEECRETPYQPKRLSGLREKNTYHNHEVSNHVYGIGLDLDPTLNTCCGCVARWAEHPLCKQPVDSIYKRMAMPECWVHVFERFGFYWLGRDSLQDTMHFEFLGDPNHILSSSGPPESTSNPASGDAGPKATGGDASSTKSGPPADSGVAPASNSGEAPARQPSPEEPHKVLSPQHWGSATHQNDESSGGCQACAAVPSRSFSFRWISLLTLPSEAVEKASRPTRSGF